jgi:hypothetical protein
MLSPLPRRSGWVHRLLTSPAVSAFPDMAVGSARALSFSRLARRSLALRPAHSRCHRISWHASPKASTVSLPPQLLRLLPAGAVAGWGLHPQGSAALSRRTPRPDGYPLQGAPAEDESTGVAPSTLRHRYWLAPKLPVATVASGQERQYSPIRQQAANSCRSEAQTGSSIAAGRNPTPNFVGLGQVRSVAPSLQIS